MREKEIEVTPLYHKYIIENDYPVVIQIGGRFSGKSQNEQIRLAANLMNNENYKLLVIEDLETGMADGFHAGLRDRIAEFEHTDAYNPRSRTAFIRNELNKNEVLFRGYITEQQKLNVKKLSGITEIVVEESEWINYDSFTSLLQQLRGGNKKDRKLTLLMNPVNPDCFVNEMFVESMPDKVFEYFKDGRPKVFEKHIITSFEYNGETITDSINVLVVMSTHHDNPYLTFEQRASIEQLKDTDPEKYKQLGECKFIRSEGTFFKEFNYGVHVVEPFEIPKHWNRYTSKDYGLDMLANYWFAVDTHNNTYVYKELYEPDLIISEAAKRIKEVNGDDKPLCKYAPPDLWNRRQETGRSADDIFRENGESCIKSNNDRVDGWLALKELLKPIQQRDIQTGETITTSRLKIFSNCVNLIRTLPKLQRSESNPNDVANEPHEWTHAPDAIRGYAIMRQRPTVEEVIKRDPFARKPKETYTGGEATKSYLGV